MEESLVQLSCLKAACKRLGLPFTEDDANGNLVRVGTPVSGLLFANFATPFNSGSVEQVCKDKEFTHRMLKDIVRMPRTVGYFDPAYLGEGYKRYKKFKHVAAIAGDISTRFAFPFIVKRNSGTRGVNVFLCKNSSDVRGALEKIFAKDSPDYDYVALAQEYIEPKAEYRVVMFKGKLVLLYLKDNRNAKFVGNLSPLHYKGARAVHLTDEALTKKIEKFLSPVFGKLPVDFGGFDLILDAKDELWLLEINSRPGFAYFIRDNGTEAVTGMYGALLRTVDH